MVVILPPARVEFAGQLDSSECPFKQQNTPSNASARSLRQSFGFQLDSSAPFQKCSYSAVTTELKSIHSITGMLYGQGAIMSIEGRFECSEE